MSPSPTQPIPPCQLTMSSRATSPHLPGMVHPPLPWADCSFPALPSLLLTELEGRHQLPMLYSVFHNEGQRMGVTIVISPFLTQRHHLLLSCPAGRGVKAPGGLLSRTWQPLAPRDAANTAIGSLTKLAQTFTISSCQSFAPLSEGIAVLDKPGAKHCQASASLDGKLQTQLK